MTFNHIDIFIFLILRVGEKNYTLNLLASFDSLPSSCNAFVNLQTSLFCQLIVLHEPFQRALTTLKMFTAPISQLQHLLFILKQFHQIYFNIAPSFSTFH